jgi:hypothetical protein
MLLKPILQKSFLFNLFTLARFSHAKKYLFKACKRGLDPYQTHVLSKNKENLYVFGLSNKLNTVNNGSKMISICGSWEKSRGLPILTISTAYTNISKQDLMLSTSVIAQTKLFWILAAILEIQPVTF